MTLLDAILAVLGGIWGFVSAPAIVLIYGVLVAILGLLFILAGCNPTEVDLFPLERLIWIAGGVALILFGLSLAVWAGSAPNPLTWSIA